MVSHINGDRNGQGYFSKRNFAKDCLMIWEVYTFRGEFQSIFTTLKTDSIE